jgi:hypothetical protein
MLVRAREAAAPAVSSAPPGLIPGAVALLLIFGAGPNFLLAFFAIVILVAGTYLVWRPGETPILLFIFSFQWLQAAVSLFHANWLGLEVTQFSPFGGDNERAIVLSLIGLLALALGMRAGVGAPRPEPGAIARMQAQTQSTIAWLRLYALAFGAASFAQSAAWMVSGLSQPLLAAATLKWAFFWMLAYATFARAGSPKIYFLGAFALELGLGVGGYFSDFKTVMFFTLFAAVAAGLRVSAKAFIGFALLGSLVIGSGIVWTAVKKDYRNFVNGGEASQAVSVGYEQRMAKLGALIGALDGTKLSRGVDDMLRRLTYVEFFGAVIDYIPRSRAHENGALWFDAVSRPFMPRLLFPSKAPIDDSERTAEYTGIDVYGSAEGTSISLGYMAESYIDFGEFGMMPAILLLGVLYGRIYRSLVMAQGSRGMLGMGMASAVLYSGALLESSITKLFGGIIVAWLVAWLLVRFVIPRTLPWLIVGTPRRRA